MSNNWVRLWHDMPTDPKWRVIAKRSGQPIATVMAVFTFVLVNASANASERGRTHNLFADDIAAALDVETGDVEAILDAMQGKVLDGDVLTGWEKRQPKREDGAAERAKQWRERKRTQANAAERPDKDTDTDTDTEIEREERTDDAPPAGVAAPSRTVEAKGQGREAPDATAAPDPAEPPAKPKAERGMRLRAYLDREGEDAVGQELGLWAKAQGLSVADINLEMQKFCDYWHAQPGQKGVKLDWPATWRNWVRRVLETKEREEKRNAVFKR